MKKILSLLLAVLMVVGMFPMSAFASEHVVVVYSTVDAIVFEDLNGNEIEAAKGPAENSSYTAYEFGAEPGIYKYSADGYGTGTIKISHEEQEIYLREVNYSLDYDGKCNFKMEVVNTEDSDLVYVSEEDIKSVNLLIPALGYNTAYRAAFKPVDDNYASFETNLWVLEGTEAFEGFKHSSYNLSDNGEYKMGNKVKVTFKIPQGAEIKVQQLVKFYRQFNEYKVTKTGTEGDFDIYESYVSDDNGGELQYVVSKEGYVTEGKIFDANVGTITIDALKETPAHFEDNNENSLITNGNAAKFIELEVGEAKDLWFSRAWQAVDSGLINNYLDPDNHFYIIDGDSVKINEYGVAIGVKKGVSVVAMTYDALYYGKNDALKKYDAIDPDQVAVFVISVGGNSSGVETGISLSDLHTFYISSSIKIDGVEEVKKNDSYKYTFTPSADGEISVSVANVYGYPTPVMSEWKEYSKNSDGSYTVDLTDGRNIIKVKSGDAEDYHVLNASKTEVTVKNVTNPGHIISAGDSFKVSYSNVITPLPKLGAIYNPGYPDTAYLTGTAEYESGSYEIEGPRTQYSLKDNACFELVAGNTGDIKISDVRINLGHFGSAPSTHYSLGLQSGGGSYSGGNSPEETAEYSFFQDFEIPVNKHECAYTEKVIADKYLNSESTDTKKATYFYSCICGAKGTETFEVDEIKVETGSSVPSQTNYYATLEYFKIFDVEGTIRKREETKEKIKYDLYLPADFDKEKSIVIAMKGILHPDVTEDTLKSLYYQASTSNANVKSEKSLYELGEKGGTVAITPCWMGDYAELILQVSGRIPEYKVYLHIGETAPECDHEWVDATCSAPKTCTKCGETEGEVNPDAHKYTDGKCEYCGAAEVVAVESPFTFKVGEMVITPEYAGIAECGDAVPTQSLHSFNLTIPAGATKMIINSADGSKNIDVLDESVKGAYSWVIFGKNTPCTLELTKDCTLICIIDNTSGRIRYHYNLNYEVVECEHEWKDATCVDPKTCSKCGVADGEADPDAHNYIEGVCEYCNVPEFVTSPFVFTIGDVALTYEYVRKVDYKGEMIYSFDVAIPAGATEVVITNSSGNKMYINDASAGVYTKLKGDTSKPYTLDLTKGYTALVIIDRNGNNDKYHFNLVVGTAECEHDWVDATCSAPKTCTKCGETEGEALGHAWGETAYSWAEDYSSCTATRECSRCTEKEVNTTNNVASSTTDATCENPGETVYTATFVNDWAETQTETIGIPALEHKDDNKDHVCDSGCSVAIGTCEDANKDHACDYGCGKAYGEHKDSTEDNDHVCDYCNSDEVLEECSGGVANCTEKATCSVCGEKYGDIDSDAHAWTVSYNWSEDGKACTATKACANNAEHNLTAEATVTSVVAKEANCSVMGDTQYTATFAADWAETQVTVRTDIAIDKDAHEWGEWKVVKEASYTEEGSKKRVCENDESHVETETIAKLVPTAIEKIEGPDDTKEYVVAYQEGVVMVPAGLENEYPNQQAVKDALKAKVENGDLEGEVNLVFREVTVGYYENGAFVPVSNRELFENGKTIDILLKYPEGADKNDKFEVYHLRDDGVIEKCEIKAKTDEGLVIEVGSLSPFAIAYESVDNTPSWPSNPGKPSKPSNKPNPGVTIITPEDEKEEANPNTGAPVVCSFDLTAAGVVVLAATAMVIGKKNR